MFSNKQVKGSIAPVSLAAAQGKRDFDRPSDGPITCGLLCAPQAQVEARQAAQEREAAAAAQEQHIAADAERQIEAKIKALLLEPSEPVPYFGRRKVAWYT